MATQSGPVTGTGKLSVGEKLDVALEFKEKGNSFYKEGNFKNAAKNYHKAILYLKVSEIVKLSEGLSRYWSCPKAYNWFN